LATPCQTRRAIGKFTRSSATISNTATRLLFTLICTEGHDMPTLDDLLGGVCIAILFFGSQYLPLFIG
jgi:hypothetical protein